MRNLRTRRYAYMVDRVRLPMTEVESWLRDYKLRCMWSYCQRHRARCGYSSSPSTN